MSNYVYEINQKLDVLLQDKSENAAILMEGQTRSVDRAADSNRQRRTKSGR